MWAVVTELEGALALKTPVTEAEYAIDERSQLSLYDCLVPTIKEHRRFKVQKDEKFSLADFKVQCRVKELEWILHKSKMPGLTKENNELKKKVEILESCLSIVEWYLAVMEDGVDTREVVKNYYDLKK